MQKQSLQKLFVEELRDLYSAENQVMTALPKMNQAASSSSLKQMFSEHMQQTKAQLDRLKDIFSNLNEKPGGEKCKGMEGLLKEGSKMMKMKAEDEVKDLGLIDAAKKVEHYEMSAYTSAWEMAKSLGYEQEAKLLSQTLEEEQVTEKLLSQTSRKIIS